MIDVTVELIFLLLTIIVFNFLNIFYLIMIFQFYNFDNIFTLSQKKDESMPNLKISCYYNISLITE